jgi:hypothetical protein
MQPQAATGEAYQIFREGIVVSDRGQGDRGESASWLEDSLPSKLFYVRSTPAVQAMLKKSLPLPLRRSRLHNNRSSFSGPRHPNHPAKRISLKIFGLIPKEDRAR